MNTTPRNGAIDWLISKRWDITILLVIVTLGACLRATGIPHGIGYHPDERHMVQVTSSLHMNSLSDALRGGMNPKSFAYGSFSFYAAWGFAQIMKPFWSQATTYDGLFYSGRIFCTFMGTVTIALSYYLAVLLYRRSLVGLIAAFLMAANVFHLQLSRYFTSDITLTTLSLISVIALIKAHQRGTLWSFLVFGACAGLATATKISSVFLTAPLFVVLGLALLREWPKDNGTAHFLKLLAIILGGIALLLSALFLIYWKGYPRLYHHRIAKESFLIPLSFPFLVAISIALKRSSAALSKLFACLAIGVLVFVIAEPFAIIDFETFTRHTREQTSMVRGNWRPPYTVQYERTMPYFYHLKQMLWYTMGWPVFTVVAIGFLVAAGRSTLDLLDKIFRNELASKTLNPEMIPLIFVVVFFLATGYFQVKFPRYLVPLYPMLFAFAAALFATVVRPQKRSLPPESAKLVSSKSLLAPVSVSNSPLFPSESSTTEEPKP